MFEDPLECRLSQASLEVSGEELLQSQHHYEGKIH